MTVVAELLALTGPVSEDRVPPRLTVRGEDGISTRGPHACLEDGNELELDERELAWLVEDAGPKALAALRGELKLRGSP